MKSHSSSASRLTRRQFCQRTVATAAAIAAPAILRGQNLNSRLNIAMIACGKRGAANLKGVGSENITLLCDVDEKAVAAAAVQYPKARRLFDFRQAFDHASEFDAVVVSTCEHTHAAATMLALSHKKHVYCEKPLTHNVHEARVVREAAAKAGVVTQMGIQHHASDHTRRAVELIQGGAIGPVHEVHVWTSRAWGLQSGEERAAAKDIHHIAETPLTAPTPAGLHWDLWLGPASYRPFSDCYVPGPRWYRWWMFGNGTMSDIGSHNNDLPFWALRLKAPLAIESFGPGRAHPEIAPATMRTVYEFGPRGDLPPVRLVWYQGNVKPDLWNQKAIEQTPNGTLFIGQKGMLHVDGQRRTLLPKKTFDGFIPPAPTLPSVASHYAEWIDACKGRGRALADFEYSGWLTESNHLGNVAYRVGKRLLWDADAMRATNAPEADAFLRREYRKGWSLG
jgi:predicted dehydrogenase